MPSVTPKDADDDDDSKSAGGYESEADANTVESTDNNDSAAHHHYRGLTPTETKAVRRLRMIMILFLICITALISILIYFYVRSIEESEFEDEFQEQGTKLVSGFRDDSFQKMQALESLSASFTSYAHAANLTWPFVTVDDSHEYFLPYLSLANAASIKILPIVDARQRWIWEDYVLMEKGWVEEDLAKSSRLLLDSASPEMRQRHLQYFNSEEDNVISPYIKNYAGLDTSPRVFMPWWQYAPVIPNRWFLNFNQLADADFFRDSKSVLAGKAVIAGAKTFLPGIDVQSTKDLAFTEELLSAGGYGQYEPGEPIGYIHYPVFQELDRSKDDTIVATLTATVYWRTYFQNILPEKTSGMVCVVENDRQVFTYKIKGKDAVFLGMEDLHDRQYDDMEITAEYRAFETNGEDAQNAGYTGVPVDDKTQFGAYQIRVYPDQEMQEEFSTSNPWLYAGAVLLVMAVAISIFVAYDCYVERRQRKVSGLAEKSSAIVSSLFPEQIKAKLYEDQETKEDIAKRNNKAHGMLMGRQTGNPLIPAGMTEEDLQTIKENGGEIPNDLLDDDGSLNLQGSAPIADLFSSATVLFMDIAGFTAWSSSREPSQVFFLLETLYGAFDKIAKQRKIFKVETIGDCYVAVCGLPEKRANHADCMARFARDCLEKTAELTQRLEPKLGPDTGDLKVRVGMHSGPVTAGVLRGDRARFQLFGDTVNTAARMESTGIPGRIQLSQECAEILQGSGKSSWVKKRKDTVHAKGKGELETYWLLPKREHSVVSSAVSTAFSANDEASERDAVAYMEKTMQEKNQTVEASLGTKAKHQRLVEFNFELLLSILKKIAAKNNAQDRVSSSELPSSPGLKQLEAETRTMTGASSKEAAEIISLPKFDEAAYDGDDIEVSPDVMNQLREFCTLVAANYRSNSFHSFEHAAHVTQSSVKLLSRIVAAKDAGNTMEAAHDHTFGITSDPLTQFSVVFASLIHDIDHRGVPNSLLAQEEPALADLYNNQAIAEQKSIDVAWNLLMVPRFELLRRAIYKDETELKRFRQLVTNCLLATDIFDKDLKALREKRWQNAFHETEMTEDTDTATNRKATIVIEHIIQASDVSHTMQHWHVYCKWNERLFYEMLKAYRDGRSTSDPTESWYKGELWFFDNYVIPLAYKLEECGVFGVSSDEFLNYARANRKEWEKKGQSIVESYLETFNTRGLSTPQTDDSSYKAETDDSDADSTNDT